MVILDEQNAALTLPTLYYDILFLSFFHTKKVSPFLQVTKNHPKK